MGPPAGMPSTGDAGAEFPISAWLVVLSLAALLSGLALELMVRAKQKR
jgi:hypothetical protein